jgi:hypothetical protein
MCTSSCSYLLVLLVLPTFLSSLLPVTSGWQADSPEVRVLLGGPDQRLFDYAGQLNMTQPSV